MLLDPFKKQLHLPTLFIKHCNIFYFNTECIHPLPEYKRTDQLPATWTLWFIWGKRFRQQFEKPFGFLTFSKELNIENHTAFHLEAVQTFNSTDQTLIQWCIEILTEKPCTLTAISAYFVTDEWFS